VRVTVDTCVVTTCGSCQARLAPTDRFCPACDAPNVDGPLAPKFRSPLTDLPREEHRLRRRRHSGGPTCPRCGEDEVPSRAAYCPTCGMDLADARRAAAFSRDQVTGVWTTPGPHNLDPYRSLRGLTWVMRAGVAIVVGVVAAWSAAQVLLYLRLDQTLPGPAIDPEATREWIGRLSLAAAAVGVAVLLLTVGWTNRAYRNLPALAVSGLRFSPDVVAASWLVPGVNLIIPKLVLDELWRGSGPDEAPGTVAWRRRSVPFISHLGWGVLMAGATGAVLADLGLAGYTGGDLAGLRLVLLLGAASGLAIVLGVVLMAVLVGQVAERQRGRADVLGPPEFVVVRAERWADRPLAAVSGDGAVAATEPSDGIDSAPAADGTVPTALRRPASGPTHVVWGRY
jgi:hypothetical protein